MISLETFKDLAALPVENFAPKPTTLTEGQLEASAPLWTSKDRLTKIGVWECTPGDFTADRSTVAEFCHIISGRATVRNHDGSGARDIGPGDLLVLPAGWKGEWTIHSHIRKLFVLQANA
ncbi:cupin domain-containing protein [uncultured Roseovarius sp.]|uniref:cupin domain-containing protein n=1 Tax=Roseovarius sp. TaxID=1486281 RepID=UPI0025F131C1|nr:cupin domain-containing protein [uncultured Roseovarius sp.]